LKPLAYPCAIYVPYFAIIDAEKDKHGELNKEKKTVASYFAITYNA